MGAVLSFLTAAWAAIAPEPAYALRWTAPAACPDQAAVVQQIEALRGGEREAGVFVTAEGVVVEDGGQYSLTLRIATESGSRERTMKARDCEELGTVAASLVAIAIGPGAARGHEAEAVEASGTEEAEANESTEGTESTESTEADEGTAEPRPRPSPAASSAPPRSEVRTSTPEARAVATALVAGAGVSVGVLPTVTPAVELGAGVSWRALYVQASVRYRVPSRADHDGGTAELWTLGADARGCGAPRWRRMRFPLCVGVEAGTIAGRSAGVTMPGRGHAPWVALSAGGGLVVSLGRRLGLAVGADLLVPVVRAGFEIEGIGVLHRVGPVAMDATLGLHVKIP